MKFSLFFRVASKVNDCTITKDLINISIKAGTGGNDIMELVEMEVCELRAEHGQHSRQVKLVGKSGKDFVTRGGKGGCAENKYKGQPGEHFDIKLFMPS
ncbi:OBG-type G domain-containing protein [Meloidogyne graminicola]|uniref:OBG-type G domain-containing protein n=1 Tax=Meloidogyne graminicola TaxID=189291 RepID=A0A8S9ZGF5_9BILA|nr:OBG-type G domain-containing protein [Meloidogyne graminicola]